MSNPHFDVIHICEHCQKALIESAGETKIIIDDKTHILCSKCRYLELDYKCYLAPWVFSDIDTSIDLPEPLTFENWMKERKD